MKAEPRKKLNIPQVVKYLNHAFGRAQQQMLSVVENKSVSDATLRHYQVEFSYLLDDIQRGPAYIAPKLISDANTLIENLSNITNI